MTEELDIEIVEYSDEMAAAIAEMWNSWDELWPGGFTNGVPYTEERVLRGLGQTRALGLFIAFDKKEKKPVGYCSLLSHWRDEDAAYIGVLGVSPEALGKKVGKRLLLRSMDRALEKGYSRVDLSTWAGNLRAMPLYKKIGFMWNPVHPWGVILESFIPEILSHPLCSPFFADYKRSNAWYDVQQRDLAQVPDDIVEDGMGVYKYQFTDADKNLVVTVDRLAKTITGLNRTLDGQKLVVSARVEDHDTICGVPNEYSLTVENGTDKELSLSVELKGFPGIEFLEPERSELKVAKGDSVVWNIPFHVDSIAPVHRADRRSVKITTVLDIDRTKTELGTGLEIRPAAEVYSRISYCKVPSGGRSKLELTVRSRSKRKLKGVMKLLGLPSGLIVSPAETELEIAPKGLAGAILDVEAGNNLEHGTYELSAYLELDYKEDDRTHHVRTRTFRIPIFCAADGAPLIGEDERLKRRIIITDNFFGTMDEEGAAVRLRSEVNSWSNFILRCEYGPPFGLSPFRNTQREIKVTESEGVTTIAACATHPERPLNLEERLVMKRNSAIVKHEVWATNTSDESHSFKLRLMGGGGGLSLGDGSVVLPLKSGLTEESYSNMLFGYPSIPNTPDTFSEGWLARKKHEGVSGQFWNPQNIDAIQVKGGQINRIELPEVILGSGETRCISEVWTVFGLPNWQSIRRLWRQTVQREIPVRRDLSSIQEPKPSIFIDTPNVVIPNIEETLFDFTLRKKVVTPLAGQLSITAPNGWKGEFTQSQASSLSIENIGDGDSFSAVITPTAKVKEGFSLTTGEIILSCYRMIRQPISVLILGTDDSSVQVDEIQEEGIKVLEVNNGLIEFKVAPDYGGCVTSLKNRHGRETLATAFPSAKPKSFIENYYGGIQPVVWDEEYSEDALTKAKTNQEKMKSKIFDAGFWKGVELSWTGKAQQTTRGTSFKLRYLTAPGSPLLVVTYTIHNKSSAPLNFFPSLWVDAEFNGDGSKLHVTSRWKGPVTELLPSPFPNGLIPEKSYVLLTHGPPDTATDGLGIIGVGREMMILGFYIPDLKHTGTMAPIWLKPGEKKSLSTIIVADIVDVEMLDELLEVAEEIVETTI